MMFSAAAASPAPFDTDHPDQAQSTTLANAFAERWVGSVRRECTDRLLIFSRNYLEAVVLLRAVFLLGALLVRAVRRLPRPWWMFAVYVGVGLLLLSLAFAVDYAISSPYTYHPDGANGPIHSCTRPCGTRDPWPVSGHDLTDEPVHRPYPTRALADSGGGSPLQLSDP